MGWMRGLFRRKQAENILDEEVRRHIELLSQEYESSGMTPAEARRAAQQRFGRVSSVKERVREQNGIAQVETLRQDLHFAFRTFTAQKGFAAVLLLTLALGIGANTAVYSVLRAVLLKPLPLPDPERVVFLWEQDRVNHTMREPASYPDYQDLRRAARSFEHLAAAQNASGTLTGQGDPERVQAIRVTSNYFAVLGLRPVIGRVFAPGEPGIVLSHALWQRKFGGAEDVLGRQVRLDGFSGTILGVMPPEANSIATQQEDLWTALESAPVRAGRGQHNFRVMGRLRSGTSLASAQAEVSGIMARLEKDFADDNAGRQAEVVPLHEDLAGGMRPALRVLTGAVALLLVVACLNIANLLLARASARSREMAIRTSLGAERSRLLRQLLTESFALALAGAGLGIAVAEGGVRLLLALAPESMTLIGRAAVDWNSMAMAIAIGIGAWLLFGVVPALRASAVAPGEALKESGNVTVSKGALRWRNGLVLAQVALTSVLVISSGLLIRSFWRLQRMDLGYEPKGAVTLRFQLPETRYATPQFSEFRWPQGLAFHDRVRSAASAIPGVEAASIVMAGPNRASWTTRVAVVGRPVPPADQQEEAQVRTGDPGYLKATGAVLKQGRFFTGEDSENAPPVMVVNEAFVRRYFPAENPVGQSAAALFGPRRIIGVIGDMRYSGPASLPVPTMYFPAGQFALPESTLIVRTRGDAAALVPVLRRLITGLDANIAPFDAATLESSLETATARQRFIMSLLTGFALLALLLAVVGVYGVVAYAVGRREKEIALRIALGAGRANVFRQIAGGTVLRASAGVAAGLIAAAALGRLLEPLLFATSPRDTATYAVVAGVLLAAAFLGAAIPAHRAARLNAATTLRQD